MKNRSKVEIIGAILECVMTGATRTRIISQAALTIYQADEYLAYLKEYGLVTGSRKHFFRITEKGIRYQCRFRDIRELIAIPGRKAEGLGHMFVDA